MNAVLKIFLSMSVSGGLLILVLLLGKHFWQDKISRQWQYYIWLVVVLRLLLPFGPEVNLLGKSYQAVDQVITQAAPLPSQRPAINPSGNILVPAVDLEQNNENVNSLSEDLTAVRPLQDIGTLFINHVWLAWLVVVLGLLIRKITIYQGFMRYIHAGLTPVSNIELLDRLSIVAEQAGIKKPIELCINPLISSPLLIGFFRPCIVLPNADIADKDFQYIVLHELTHYKRLDMFYKWLVQITVCLHWFNPLVHLMSRKIAKACEFSCDEAVLTKTGSNSAADYGKTLLDAMAAVGKYRENLGAVTLSENKRLLKERLGAIMNFKRKTRAARLLTGALTLCMILGAAFVGVYPVAAASNHLSGKPPVSGKQHSTQVGTSEQSDKDYASQAEREVTELLGNMSDDDDDWQENVGGRVWYPQLIPVNYETMADGEIIWLGEYTLSEGDRIWYHVLAETGNGLQVGFTEPGDTDLSTTYYSVANLRQEGVTLECTSSFTFGSPVKPGTYSLFLRATDGALGNVKGDISIGFIADASWLP